MYLDCTHSCCLPTIYSSFILCAVVKANLLLMFMEKLFLTKSSFLNFKKESL